MDRQRIDKWLWHARVVRTRSAAAALVDAGHVRINSGRIDAPSRPVRAGDVVTVALDRSVRVLKVTGYADRRDENRPSRTWSSSQEPRGKEPDPNSPFAKLLALKAQLEANKERH